jgi:hypothetical protein
MSGNKVKITGGILGAVASVYALAVAGLYTAMRQPPETFGLIMSKIPMPAMMVLPFQPLWMSAREGNLRIGGRAPDFLLPALDGSRVVRLSTEFRERPVVLVFGSYTWPPFRREVPALNRLYDTYRDRVAFHIVYIQEAHPTDLWQLASNVRDGVSLSSPRTDGERTEAASACVRKLGIRIPALLDGIGNQTERAYTAWPDRLYLIGRNGEIVFKSAPGPYGFSMEGLVQALRAITPQ